jgi:competence protein ComEC
MLASTTIRLALIAALAMFAIAAFVPTAGAFADRDCSDFSTWKAAQRFYKTHNPKRDPHGLDADHDGIACEDLR